MGGKRRVHELAKEFGVPSKEVLARLAGDGVFVKSASSTLEASVVRRLRESIGVDSPVLKRPASRTDRQPVVAPPIQATASGGDARRVENTKSARPGPTADNGARPSSRFTSSDALDVYKRHQRALTSEDPRREISDLFRECEVRYGISRSALRKMVNNPKLRERAADGKGSDSSRNGTVRTVVIDNGNIRRQDRSRKPRKSGSTGTGAQTEIKVPGTGGLLARSRPRTPGLPSLAEVMNLEAVADIVDANTSSAYGRRAIADCLKQLASAGPDEYGYLAWRYAAIRSAHSEARLTSAHQDLIALAVVIDHEKQLLDALVRSYGSILTQPSMASHALETEFRKLAADNVGRTPDDELRRARASFEFLRRALVLTIANPGSDHRLWNMLGWIQPSPKSRLQTSPQLERATRRLGDLIATVETLFSADETKLASFFHHSRAQLVALQLKRFDFLRRFRDSAAAIGTTSYQLTEDLRFQVLPQGEQLRSFLGRIRASKVYRGYRVDERRLTVLEDLQSHFGAHRCVWHTGSNSADGIGIRYLVLAIKSGNGSGENAVAISPLAGRHATYVVRRDCAEADWKTLFAHPKFEARLLGARRLLFTAGSGHGDQYVAMRDKVIRLLECDRREFRQQPRYRGLGRRRM